jgi:hypothetical protein
VAPFARSRASTVAWSGDSTAPPFQAAAKDASPSSARADAMRRSTTVCWLGQRGTLILARRASAAATNRVARIQEPRPAATLAMPSRYRATPHGIPRSSYSARDSSYRSAASSASPRRRATSPSRRSVDAVNRRSSSRRSSANPSSRAAVAAASSPPAYARRPRFGNGSARPQGSPSLAHRARLSARTAPARPPSPVPTSAAPRQVVANARPHDRAAASASAVGGSRPSPHARGARRLPFAVLRRASQALRRPLVSDGAASSASARK